jgi:hypothetical protein
VGTTTGSKGRGAAPRSRDEWLGHFRRCRAGGQSLKGYAEQHGLDVAQFYQWHSRLKSLGLVESAPAPSFARVEVTASAAQAEASRRLTFPNGLVLEWQGAADLQLIGQLLRLEASGR